MKQIFLAGATTGAVLVASAANAQTAPAEVPDLGVAIQQPSENRNKVSLSYRMGLNVTAQFKKLGGYPALNDPGPATGGTYNRNYDNGYNRVDSSGNAGDLTWYWGYENAGSLQGSQLALQSSSSKNNLQTDGNEDNPQQGFEISYSRELISREKWRGGAEFAFGYSSMSISDTRNLRGNVDRITDSYSLGIVPPLAPYHGTFEGPGALIDSSPDRSTTVLSQAAAVSGRRTLETDLFTLRAGPYLEIPIYGKLSGTLNAGFLAVCALSDFGYSETVTISGLPTLHRGGTASQTDWLFGGYVGGGLSYAFNQSWGVFAGAQLQLSGASVTDTPDLPRRSMDRKEAVLDLGKAIVVSLGVSYSF